MFRRLGSVLLVSAGLVTSFTAVSSGADNSGWNGVWAGELGTHSKVSLTVVNDRVKNYQYGGAPVQVSYNKVAGTTLSFGDHDNYNITLKLVGAGVANGTYHGRHGFVAVSLKKQ
jgi:hypothetical protein